MARINDNELSELMNRADGYLSEISAFSETDSEDSVQNTSDESHDNSEYDYLLNDVDEGEDDLEDEHESEDEALDLNTYQNLVAKNHEKNRDPIDDITQDFENLSNETPRFNIVDTSDEDESNENKRPRITIEETDSDDDSITRRNQRYSTPVKKNSHRRVHFQSGPSYEQDEFMEEFMNVEPPMNTEPRAGRGRGRPRGRGRRRGRGHGQGQNVNIYRRSERIANNPVANEMYDASDEDQEIEQRVPRLADVGHQITLNQLDNKHRAFFKWYGTKRNNVKMEKFPFNPKRPVGPNPNVFDPLKKDWSELEVVELFLTSNLIKEILTFTNRFGEDKLLNKSKAKKNIMDSIHRG